MRLLRKKTDREIVRVMTACADTTRRALKLAEDKDREIERLQAELAIQQVFREYREYPSLSNLVH